MKARFLILFTLFIGSTAFGHKFYVSIADLAFNTQENRIEGSLKITAHDFEALLENKFQKKIDIEQVADTSVVGRYVQSYLADHFKLLSGGVQAKPNYLGKEVSLRQELFFYFTFTNVKNPSEIKVISTILFGIFPEQQKFIHYKYQEQTKSVTLVPSKNHEKIKFDE